MSTALAVRQTSMMATPRTLDEVIRMADIFAQSGMFSGENGMKQNAAQLAVKILAGQELGFAPFAAANGMYIIKGKCAPGANLIASKIAASPIYSYTVTKMTDAEVSITFCKNGQPIGVSSFTAQDAAKAGTQNMGKFPRNMLFARAMSNGARWYCPDVFNGVAVYTPDELGETVDYDAEVEGNPSPLVVEVKYTYPETWTDGKVVKQHAIDSGWCANEFEARNSLLNSLQDVTGQKETWNADKARDVFQHFYDKHVQRKQAQTQEVVQ